MKMLEDWRQIAAKAWSIRLTLIAAVLSAAEVTLQALMPSYSDRPWFAVAAGLTSLSAAIARLLDQGDK